MSPRPARARAIDALRGVAVVLMIQWHTADAWIADGSRGATAFVASRLGGGLAAPAFLLLAGLSLAYAAPARPDRAWLIASARRAVQIVLAGYALNLYAWAVDHGAVIDRPNRAPIALLALALGLAAAAISARPRTHVVRVGLVTAALAALAAASAQLHETTRLGTTLLPRLDVLHGIGAALLVTAPVLLAVRSIARPEHRAAALAGIAIGIACASVVVIGVPHASLPASFADWIARGARWPAATTAAFPLFPWLAYAILGAAIATWMRAGRGAPEPAWALPRIARPGVVIAIAIAIAALTFEPSPSARMALDHAEWLRSAFRLAFNASVIAAIGGAIAVLGSRGERALAPLEVLGRHSLLIYAAHLELAYGLAGIPLRRSLGFASWALLASTIVLAMLALGRAIDAHARRRRADAREHGHVHASA